MKRSRIATRRAEEQSAAVDAIILRAEREIREGSLSPGVRRFCAAIARTLATEPERDSLVRYAGEVYPEGRCDQ